MSRPIKLPENINDYNFKKLSSTTSHPRTKIRLLALYHLQQGTTYSEVAKYMQVNITSVKMWLYRFRDEGIDGLNEKPRTGRKSLTAKHSSEAIFKQIIQISEQKQGGRVRLADIDKMLKEKFNIHYKNLNGVHYLVTRLGISWIGGLSKQPKQDQQTQGLHKKIQSKDD